MMVCDMHSGGLPERTNDRLACVGRLGIRFYLVFWGGHSLLCVFTS